MYIYLDESGTDGQSKNLIVGGICTSKEVDKNLIRSRIKKYIRKPNFPGEIKHNNRDITQKVKSKIFKDIKDKYDIIFDYKKYNPKNLKEDTSRLIANCLEKVNSGQKIEVVFVKYDKSDLKVTKETIAKYLSSKINFEFEMIDSERSPGVQCADWVVGEISKTTLN